jgi:hypothetical protein
MKLFIAAVVLTVVTSAFIGQGQMEGPKRGASIIARAGIPGCNSDNVLRALVGKKDVASTFCSGYIGTARLTLTTIVGSTTATVFITSTTPVVKVVQTDVE